MYLYLSFNKLLNESRIFEEVKCTECLLKYIWSIKEMADNVEKTEMTAFIKVVAC